MVAVGRGPGTRCFVTTSLFGSTAVQRMGTRLYSDGRGGGPSEEITLNERRITKSNSSSLSRCIPEDIRIHNSRTFAHPMMLGVRDTRVELSQFDRALEVVVNHSVNPATLRLYVRAQPEWLMFLDGLGRRGDHLLRQEPERDKQRLLTLFGGAG